MNKKTTIVAISLLLSISICSCTPKNEKKYVVTFKNYDGVVLQELKDMREGVIPEYRGQTPTKEKDEKYYYTFSNWYPEIVPVSSDAVYTAQYTTNDVLYSITWLNFDGEVLEQNNSYKYGEMPEYRGQTPTKASTKDFIYLFNGWSPNIENVTKDATYTAIFKEIPIYEGLPGIEPVFNEDLSQVKYGFYPTKHVKDEDIINALNALNSPTVHSLYSLNSDFYYKDLTSLYNEEDYYFDDGDKIINGETYWFKVEPITWDVNVNNDGTILLLSSQLLDVKPFYHSFDERLITNKKVYCNNYDFSDIREWLNNTFYDMAFCFNDSYVKEITLDNSANTTDNTTNIYAEGQTLDKVFLPSYQDYNEIVNIQEKEAKTTDYARIKGAWCNIKKDINNSSLYNGTYWTRSPCSDCYYGVWGLSSGGYFGSRPINSNSICVRPAICLTINQ